MNKVYPMHTSLKRLSALFLVALIAISTIGLPTQRARAATILVTSAGDTGPGTLRDAVSTAQPSDQVRFNISGGCPCTIFLSSPIMINKALDIQGLTNQTDITIRPVTDYANGLFNISGTGMVRLANLKLMRGGNVVNGGAVYSTAPLTLDKMLFENNRVGNSGNVSGGALYTTAALSITDSTFKNNYGQSSLGNATGGALYISAAAQNITISNTIFDHNGAGANSAVVDVGSYGGAIYINAGNVSLQNNTQFSANDPGGTSEGKAGAIMLADGTLTTSLGSGVTFSYNHALTNGGAVYVNLNPNTAYNFTSTFFTSNSAGDTGGAIYSNPANPSTVLDTMFENNSANKGAAIAHGNGTLNISQSTFCENDGINLGTLFLNGGTTNISRSTFNENFHSGTNPDGAVIYNNGSAALNVANSTIANNIFMGTNGGAPIFNKGATTLTNVTIARNIMRNGSQSAGGIYQSAGTLHLGNSLVASNSIEFIPKDIEGGILSDGHNLVQTRGTSTGYVASDLPNGTDPLLTSLADNGGKTKTIALLPASLAVDGGDNTICASAPVANLDQRGAVRPIDGNGDSNAICDIGAYELPAVPTLTLSASTASAAVLTPIVLTHTITNPSTGNTFSGVSFTNELPPNMVIAAAPNITNNCTTLGTVTATPGSNVISVTGVALSTLNCSITVNIMALRPGLYNLQARGLSSLQGGQGAASNTIAVRVGNTPVVSLSLSAPAVKVGATASVVHTLTNPNNALTLTGVSLTHTFNGMLTVENPVSLCGGSASVNANILTISGVTLTPGQSCTVTVDASTTTPGSYLLGTSPVSALETGAGAASNQLALAVVNVPTISLSLSPNTIYPGGTTRFEYTLTNPNSFYGLSNVTFAHSLTGVTVATQPTVNTNCTTPGSITAPPSSATLGVSGIKLEPGQTCKVTVNISGNTLGGYPNMTTAISSAETGAGAASNSATLTISPSAVRIQLSAGGDLLRVGNTTQLTYQITNTNMQASTIDAVHNLASYIRIPIGAAINTTCTGTPFFNIGANGASLTISKLTIPGSASCTVSFNVLGQSPGRFLTGVTGITSTPTSSLPNSNELILNVVTSPTVSLDFAPRTLNLNNQTRVTLRLSNPNQISATNVAFSYALNGVTVAATPDVVNTCGGSFNATALATSVGLTGTTLNASQTCTISFNAKASNTPGNYTNTTATLSSLVAGTGATSNSVLVKVLAPPTLSASLSAAAIRTGGTTIITYTLSNPNAASTGLTNVGFVHNLPPEIFVNGTPNVTGNCGNLIAAVSAPANGHSIVVDGLTLAQAQSSCTVSVTLTSSITGEYSLQATNFFTLQGGVGVASAPITLRVARYDCTLGGLDSALANGGNATFACSNRTVLSLNSPRTVTNNTVIDGGGLLEVVSAINAPPGWNRPNARDGRIFGAIQVDPGVTLRISGVTFNANNDPTIPPLGIVGTAVITNVTFTGNVNSGALIAYTGANVTIYNSTFANNTVLNNSTQSDGGALYLEPNTTVNVYNSTFANNSVSSTSLSQNGGAIYVAQPATLNLTNVTFSGNNANGAGKTIYVEAGAFVTLTNSIIANSVAGNCFGTIIDGGHNLQYPDTSCGASIPVGNPLLNALAANGGHTQTMSLQVGSPALNNGDYNTCQTTLKNVDQRGYIRQTANTTCDIGAYENAGIAPTLNLTAPNSVALGTPFNVTVAALDGSNNTVTGYLGIVRLTSTNANATLPTDYTFQDTDSGVHDFSVTLNQTGTFNLTATDSQNNGSDITKTASITVLYHPTVALSFAPASISPGGTSALRVALSNPNTVPLTQTELEVDLPDHVSIASIPAVTNTCGDGDVSAAPDDTEIEISHVTLSAGEACLITVQITSTVTGSYPINAVKIETAETSTAPDSAEVVFNVGSVAPTMTFNFAPNAIKVNNVTVVTYALQNNDSGALTNLSFTHNLPAGLTVAETPGIVVTCATPGTVTANAGSGTITVSGVGLAGAQSCLITVNVTPGLNSGSFTTSVSGITTNETGATAAASSSDTLTVTVGKRDTVGIYRPSVQTFYLRNQNTTGPADISVIVGGFAPSSNFKPVVGDWNGDQVDTVGLYDTSLGFFYLSDSNTTGTVSYSFVMGNPGDSPLAGRWSPDMAHDGVGVYRPSNGILYLKNALTGGFSDYYAVMGNPSDRGVAGDFNGDGIDTVGIYRVNEARYYLSNATPNGITFADFTLLLGNPTEDDPFTGDWVGQGYSGVGVFRRANGIVYLKNSLTGIYADTYLVYGISGDVPVAGRWTNGALPPPQVGINGVIVPPGTGGTNPVENGKGD
jgi:predicted outer membrane repeat protein